MAEDYSNRAAIGQAFNLAVHAAIKNDRENDTKYIYRQFTYYRSLGTLVQSGDSELLLEALQDKKLEKALKELESILGD